MTDNQKLIATLRKVLDDFEADSKPKATLPDRYTPDDLPDIGSSYYRIIGMGQAQHIVYHGDVMDRAELAQGNAYRTKEAAEAAAKRQRIHFWLECLAAKAWADAGEVIDWSNYRQSKYCLVYEHGEEELSWTFEPAFSHPNTVYFPSEKSIDAAIQEIGEDNINFYCRGGV